MHFKFLGCRDRLLILSKIDPCTEKDPTVCYYPLTEPRNLNFHPLEVVSRYRDPQLQVAKN